MHYNALRLLINNLNAFENCLFSTIHLSKGKRFGLFESHF